MMNRRSKSKGKRKANQGAKSKKLSLKGDPPLILMKKSRKLLLLLASTPFQIGHQLHFLRQLAQLNYCLLKIPIQMISTTIQVSDGQRLMSLFTKLTQNKQIILCILCRAIEGWFWAFSSQEKANSQQLKKFIEELIEIAELSFDLYPSNRVLLEGWKNLLNKCYKWCRLYPQFSKHQHKIFNILEENS